MSSKSLFFAVVALVLTAGIAIYTSAVERETKTTYDLSGLKSELRSVAKGVSARIDRQDAANQAFLDKTVADVKATGADADDLAAELDGVIQGGRENGNGNGNGSGNRFDD